MRLSVSQLLLLLLCSSYALAELSHLEYFKSSTDNTTMPVIGIYAQPSHFTGYDTQQYQYVLNANIDWVQMSGAQAVIVPFDETQEYYDHLFSKINGILFTGGDLNISLSSQIPFQPEGQNQFTLNAAYLLNKTIQANQAGDYFPVWGTCQGFQLIQYIVSNFNDSILHHISNDYNVTRVIRLSTEHMKLDMLRGINYNFLEFSQSDPSFLYLHELGVLASDYESNRQLKHFFRIGATSKNSTRWFNSQDSVSYLAVIEAFDFPIYGVQFHPEYTIFEWNFNSNKSKKSLEISSYFSRFFIQQARKNNHQFSSTEERDSYLAYNYPSVHVAGSIFTQITFIPRKN